MSQRGESAKSPDELRRDPEGLLPLVYDRLRELAAHYMRNEKDCRTLQPTAVVHEAYLRLAGMNRIEWMGKTHFYAMAATAMRRVLVDHARAASAKKRGSKPVKLVLDENLVEARGSAIDLLAVDQSMTRLAAESSRQAQVAELRLFGGLKLTEIGETLGISLTTVKQDWRVARAWLAADLR